MRKARSDRQWEFWGDVSPYYGVAIYDKYKSNDLDEETLAEFFDSGEQHVSKVLDIVHERVESDLRTGRCLDFGCGVGRLSLPLAKRFGEVVGVDISKLMLKEAERNRERYGFDNLTFVESDDSLSRVEGKFDLIHSYIVFQHIPRERGEMLLEKMLSMLEDDGVAALHFTFFTQRSAAAKLKYWLHTSVPLAHNLINLFKGRKFNHPYTLIVEYDLSKLLRIIHDGGCEHVYLRYSNHNGLLGVMLFCQKKRAGIFW